MIFAFGEFELDADLYRLRRNDEVIRLQPKVFSVLHYLIQHRDRVVSKQELLDENWPDETLTESVLARTIAVARKALGQKRGDRQPIETDYGRGYRFTAEVAVRKSKPSTPRRGSMPPPVPDDGGPQSDPFVGRVAVMERMHGNLQSVQGGQGRLLLVAGEPGIGKTRACEELCAIARAEGASVWQGRCFEGDGAPAFWPWIQVLRACAREEGRVSLMDLAGRDAPLLAQLAPEFGGQSTPDPATPPDPVREEGEVVNQRFMFLDTITRFLLRTAQDKPRVIFLDDLQWADEPSLQLLGFLVQEISASKILLLGTVRDPELPRDHPNRASLDGLIRPRASERLVLSGLEREDVDAYIEAVGGGPAPAGLAEAVHGKTEGNPFFVRESLQLLMEDAGGFAPSADGPWNVDLPDVARDVIRRRLTHLDDEVQQVLRMASVMGHEFEFAVLEQASQLGDQRLLDALGDALASQLIVEIEGRVGLYSFSHGLIRDTLYEDVPSREKLRLHRLLGEVMIEVCGDEAARANEIAHHFHHALPEPGVVEAAVRYAKRAGNNAMRVYAFDEAALSYRSAIDALGYAEAPSKTKRFQLLLLLGQALANGGESQKATEVFNRAIELSRGMKRYDLLGWAAFSLAVVTRLYFTWSESVDAAVQEALAHLPQDDRVLRPRLLMEAALPQSMVFKPEERKRLLEQAIALFDPDDQEVAWRRLRAGMLVAVDPAKPQERFAAIDEMLQLAATSEIYRGLEFEAKRFRYALHIEMGDVVAADRDLADSARIAADHRMTLGVWYPRVVAVGRAFVEGRLSDMEVLLPRAVEEGRRLKTPAADLLEIVYASMLIVARGQERMLDSARLDIEREHSWTGPPSRLGMLRFAAEIGRAEEVRRDYDQFADADFQNVPRNEFYLSSITALAVAAHALRDRRGGARLYQLLRPFTGRVAMNGLYMIEGSVDGALALTSALDHDYEAAREHLERSVALFQGMGFHALSLHEQYNLARCLLRTADAADRRRATELAEAVHEEASVLGLLGIVQRVTSLKPL